MSPTVLWEGPCRVFFFPREEERPHVHVSHPDGEAKLWITPDVELRVVIGLTTRQVAEIESIVRLHLDEIRHAWARHFGR